MRTSSRSPLGLYTIGVFALFLAGFFLLVVFGAGSYKNAVARQNENNANRSLLGYFETCISSASHAGNVYTEDSPYGQVLVIPDGTSGYGLRIFCYDGFLMDEYARLSGPLNPEQCSPIAETSRFLVEFPEKGLLSVTTDAGTILIHLRNEGGGEIS